MPGIDSVEAARQIGAGDSIPIVLLTGYGYGEVVAPNGQEMSSKVLGPYERQRLQENGLLRP